eukprot:PhM_4_TR15212/c0_g2_i1/m.1705
MESSDYVAEVVLWHLDLSELRDGLRVDVLWLRDVLEEVPLRGVLRHTLKQELVHRAGVLCVRLLQQWADAEVLFVAEKGRCVDGKIADALGRHLVHLVGFVQGHTVDVQVRAEFGLSVLPKFVGFGDAVGKYSRVLGTDVDVDARKPDLALGGLPLDEELVLLRVPIHDLAGQPAEALDLVITQRQGRQSARLLWVDLEVLRRDVAQTAPVLDAALVERCVVKGFEREKGEERALVGVLRGDTGVAVAEVVDAALAEQLLYGELVVFVAAALRLNVAGDVPAVCLRRLVELGREGTGGVTLVLLERGEIRRGFYFGDETSTFTLRGGRGRALALVVVTSARWGVLWAGLGVGRLRRGSRDFRGACVWGHGAAGIITVVVVT